MCQSTSTGELAFSPVWLVLWTLSLLKPQDAPISALRDIMGRLMCSVRPLAFFIGQVCIMQISQGQTAVRRGWRVCALLGSVENSLSNEVLSKASSGLTCQTRVL